MISISATSIARKKGSALTVTLAMVVFPTPQPMKRQVPTGGVQNYPTNTWIREYNAPLPIRTGEVWQPRELIDAFRFLIIESIAVVPRVGRSSEVACELSRNLLGEVGRCFFANALRKQA